jgi:hypothetical protein
MGANRVQMLQVPRSIDRGAPSWASFWFILVHSASFCFPKPCFLLPENLVSATIDPGCTDSKHTLASLAACAWFGWPACHRRLVVDGSAKAGHKKPDIKSGHKKLDTGSDWK